MSHLHEREEKVCLNCGAQLIGRYCQDCGQENLEPKESAWHLILHFFSDVTHFDGKLFSTLKPLFLRPGFLTEEYTKGRRASYLNPVRMYLFISAVFFLLFMTFFIPRHSSVVSYEESPTPVKKKRGVVITAAGKKLTEIGTSLENAASEQPDRQIVLANGDTISFRAWDNWYPPTVASYDSMQKLLPKEERDGWLEKYFTRKEVSSENYMRSNKSEAASHIFSSFFHSLPYMLFLSLPVLALILKLLYIRRKEFIYVSHGIFTIHFFCLMFLLALVAFTCSKYLPFSGTINTILLLGLLTYLYQAMRYFYKQGWFKTFVKFLLFTVLGFSFIIIVFLIGAINSLLNVAS